MSNHAASYLLNEVLEILEVYGVYKHLGRPTSQELVREIVAASSDYDCNPGEILDAIGGRLGLCCSCLRSADLLRTGRCEDCRRK